MSNRYKGKGKETRRKTDEKLANELSELTHLKKDEIKKLFPKRADKEKLDELLRIVRASTTQNQKIIKLKKNIDALAPVVLKLVKHLV
jgi:hypothetical protein